MKVEYINPFISSLISTFDMVVECEVRRVSLCIKEDAKPHYDLSGMIGLSGKAVGTVVLSFSEQVALKSASAMLMEELTEFNDDVIDAVGELTNIVAGQAKKELEEYSLSISLPNVVTGKDFEIRFPKDTTAFSVQFESDWGPLALDVGLCEVRELAGV